MTEVTQRNVIGNVIVYRLVSLFIATKQYEKEGMNIENHDKSDKNNVLIKILNRQNFQIHIA